jgi:hypothetical protein
MDALGLAYTARCGYTSDGAVYVTTSQLHIPRRERTEPYRIFKLAVPQ